MNTITTLKIAPFVLILLPACGNGSDVSVPAAEADPASEANSGNEPTDSGVTMGPYGPLADAPPNTTRTIVTMDPFEVPPGGEVYLCQNLLNPFGADADIMQAQSQMTPGSHHLVVFQVDGAAYTGTEIEPCPGLEFHETVHVSQLSSAVVTFPRGVGQFVSGEKALRLQSHYVNTGSETIHTQIQIAFDVAIDPVSAHAAWMVLNNDTISVPPGASTTSASLALMPEIGDVTFVMAQSHMHRHGVHFSASLNDGPPIYETDQWSDPVLEAFDAPGLPVPMGSTVSWTCDYQNDTGSALPFGESAVSNEMCIFTALYYPAPGGRGIFGVVGQNQVTFTDQLFP